MKLTPQQVAAAQRGGSQFVPASASEVQRLSMQRRIFWLDEQPFIARRASGFQETAGTLTQLIAQFEHEAAASPEAAVQDAAAPQRTAAEEAAQDADPSPAAASREVPDQLPPVAVVQEPATPGDAIAAEVPASAPGKAPARRPRASKAPAPPVDAVIPDLASRRAPESRATRCSPLLDQKSIRTTSLALRIASAQAAGTPITGGAFVALIEQLQQTLATL